MDLMNNLSVTLAKKTSFNKENVKSIPYPSFSRGEHPKSTIQIGKQSNSSSVILS